MSRFAATKLTYKQISEGSGVPVRTVEKIARREHTDPSVSRVEKLARFFVRQEKKAA